MTILLISTTAILLLSIVLLLRVKIFKNIETRLNQGYVFDSENLANRKASAVLFGYNKFFLTSNFGSENSVKVSPNSFNFSYVESLSNSASNPFSIRKIMVKGTFGDISDLVVKATTKNVYSGQETTIPIRLSNYLKLQTGNVKETFDSTKNISIEVDLKEFTEGGVYVDGNTSLSYEMNPTSKVQIFLECSISKLREFRLGEYFVKKIKIKFGNKFSKKRYKWA